MSTCILNSSLHPQNWKTAPYCQPTLPVTRGEPLLPTSYWGEGGICQQSQLSGFFLSLFHCKGWQMWLQNDLQRAKMEENNLTALVKTVSGQQKSEEKRRPLTLIRSCCQFPTGNTNAAILMCFQPIMNDLKLPRHQNRITKTDVHVRDRLFWQQPSTSSDICTNASYHSPSGEFNVFCAPFCRTVDSQMIL